MDKRKSGASASGATAASSESRELKLDRLFGEYVNRLNSGEKLDREAILREHPELGQELLEEIATYEEIGAGKDASGRLGTLGDFQLLRQVGKGGMGVVYEALQGSMERRVAIKVLQAGMPGDTKAVMRFLREAKVAGKLQHPGIVPVYNMGVEAGTPYYSMEFVDGETLEAILRRLRDHGPATSTSALWKVLSHVSQNLAGLAAGNGKNGSASKEDPGAIATVGLENLNAASPPAAKAPAAEDGGSLDTDEINLTYCIQVARAFQGVAEALQHAHGRGVIHRDIKPSNLILDLEGRVRILDFGLARLEGQKSLTLSGEFLGTPLYMSPEQAMAHRVTVDHRTDIYSLGATLFEMLTWRPPFQGRDYKDTLGQIIARDPPTLRKINGRIPRDLETIVLKCLRKDPAERYNSAEALAQDLNRFVRGDSIEARPMTAIEKLARRAWRHRGKSAAAAAMAFLVLATGGLLWRNHRESLRTLEAGYAPRVMAALEKIQGTLWSQFAGTGRVARLEAGEELNARSAAGHTSAVGQIREGIEELRQAARDVPGKADAHYHAARGLLLLNLDREALEELETGLRMKPEFHPARILKANVLEEGGETQEAQEEFARVRMVGRSTWVEPLLKSDRSLKEMKWGDAASAFGRLLEIEADGEELYVGSSLDNLMGRGLARLQAKEYEAAIEDFARAEYLWRGWIEPTFLKGRAYALAGNLKQAEKCFEELHQRTKLKDEAAVGIINLYEGVGETGLGLSWTTKIGQESIRERMRCMVLSDQGDFVGAFKAGFRAIDLDPGDFMARIFVTWCYIHDGKENYVKAEVFCTETIKLFPKLVIAHLNLGEIFWRQKKFGAALKEFQNVLSIDPKCANAYSFMGDTLLDQGKTEEAMARHEQAIKTNPLSYDIYQKLGFFFLRVGKFDEAIRAFQKELDLPNQVPLTWALSGIAEALERQGKILEAIEAYRKACKGVPREAGSFLALAALLKKQGNLKEALLECAKAFECNPDKVRNSSLLQDLFQSLDPAELKEDLPACIEILERALKVGAEHPALLKNLSLMLVMESKSRNPTRAVELAKRAVEKTGGRDLETSAALAEVLSRCGRRKDSVRVLEEGTERADREGTEPKPLRDVRRSLLPDLASYASVDAAILEPPAEEIIPEGASWRFFRGKQEPSPALEWTQFNFSDAAWEEGPSGFGYGDGDDRTPLSDMAGNYSTVYVRKNFILKDPARYERLLLRVWADDGFVAYLNGAELGRERATKAGSRPAFNAFADEACSEPLLAKVFPIDGKSLLSGGNVLAIQVLNHTLTSSDLSLIPLLEGQLHPDPERGRKLLEAFRALPPSPGEIGSERQALLAYFEGRLLQLSGNAKGAAEKFKSANELDPTHAEPVLRLAETLRESGDLARVEGVYRAALEGGLAENQKLWDLWGALSLAEMKIPPTQLLAKFPALKSPSGPGGDLRQALESLLRGDSIRIRCGGPEYRSPEDVVWGKDRFYHGGYWFNELSGGRLGEGPSFTGEILGLADRASDAPLYRLERWFRGDRGSHSGYRIPVPPGSYEVTLHFAECGYQEPGKRVFDVLLEGKSVLENFEPLKFGFATARKETFRCPVHDGLIDIEFLPRADNPKISAIEIRHTE